LSVPSTGFQALDDTKGTINSTSLLSRMS
jgi:hypothetical protein